MDPATLAGRVYHVYDLGLLDEAMQYIDADEKSLGGEGYSVWKAASFFGEEKTRIAWEQSNGRKR
ncbi:hypothetical protein B0T16DRAFT_414913 [Cercophora newfieldiana]|uniref:Uncharacterized protein n=1 Tax=Cercophora newfieldiana TaxID=92897 RepID=A0AA39Y100_9PEZI|nr:hypothetical protein B0T16DRAFT_414913 [Cercophora newfieldiana]